MATVNGTDAETGLVPPLESDDCAVTVCVPAVNGVDGVQAKRPPALVVAVQAAVVEPSMNTATVEPGCAVPLINGCVPVVAFAAGVMITGVTAPFESTLNATGAEGRLLPLMLLAVASTVCAPLARAGETSQVK